MRLSGTLVSRRIKNLKTLTYNLYVSASQVISRHELLEITIGVRDDEIVSYNIAHSLPIVMTISVVLSSLLGVASFLLYNYIVGLLYFLNIIVILLISFSFTPGLSWYTTVMRQHPQHLQKRTPSTRISTFLSLTTPRSLESDVSMLRTWRMALLKRVISYDLTAQLYLESAPQTHVNIMCNTNVFLY